MGTATARRMFVANDVDGAPDDLGTHLGDLWLHMRGRPNFGTPAETKDIGREPAG